jgi:hypothetical protein
MIRSSTPGWWWGWRKPGTPEGVREARVVKKGTSGLNPEAAQHALHPTAAARS